MSNGKQTRQQLKRRGIDFFAKSQMWSGTSDRNVNWPRNEIADVWLPCQESNFQFLAKLERAMKGLKLLKIVYLCFLFRRREVTWRNFAFVFQSFVNGKVNWVHLTRLSSVRQSRANDVARYMQLLSGNLITVFTIIQRVSSRTFNQDSRKYLYNNKRLVCRQRHVRISVHVQHELQRKTLKMLPAKTGQTADAGFFNLLFPPF